MIALSYSSQESILHPIIIIVMNTVYHIVFKIKQLKKLPGFGVCEAAFRFIDSKNVCKVKKQLVTPINAYMLGFFVCLWGVNDLTINMSLDGYAEHSARMKRDGSER